MAWRRKPLLVLLLAALVWFFVRQDLESRSASRARRRATPGTRAASAPASHDSRVTRVYNSLDLLPDAHFEVYLNDIYDESSIDVRFLIVPAVEGSIEDYARAAARRLGVGGATGSRGLLFVYGARGHRLRIEVGPQMEGMITDHFAGYLMREHVRDFAAAGNLSLGFRLMLFIVHRRIREAVLGDVYDPRAVDFAREPHRLAAGGGASARFPAGTDASVFTAPASDSVMRAYFAPQPDIASAYNRWLEWLATDAFPKDVPLFTPSSAIGLGRLHLTRGYGDFILFGMFGKRHEIVERDSLAMIYYTGTPFVSPNFLRLTPEGWRMDIGAELRNSQEWVTSPMTWTLLDSKDEYSNWFRDLYVRVGGALRVKYGDNRRLPVRVGR